MSRSDIISHVIFPSDEFYDMHEFKQNFNCSELPVKDFLTTVQKSAVPTANEITNKMKKKVLKRKSELNEAVFSE